MGSGAFGAETWSEGFPCPSLHSEQTFSVFVHVKVDQTPGNAWGGLSFLAKPLQNDTNIHGLIGQRILADNTGEQYF